MLTSKQIKILKKEANALKPVVLIGKEGLSNNSFVTINQALEAHELIKVSVLQNCDHPHEELILDICARCHCEFVFNIGRTLIFYKKSKKRLYNI